MLTLVFNSPEVIMEDLAVCTKASSSQLLGQSCSSRINTDASPMAIGSKVLGLRCSLNQKNTGTIWDSSSYSPAYDLLPRSH